MSRYINIASASTTTLASKDNYSTNTSLNRRGSNKVTINKVCIANAGTVDATCQLVLQAITNSRTLNQPNANTNKLIFDEDVIVSEANQIRVGDTCIGSDGVTLHGNVVSVNPSQKSVIISASRNVTDNEVLTFRAQDEKLYIVKTVVPVGTSLALYDPFTFNVNKYKLVLITSVSSGTPSLTVRIE